MKVLLSAFGFSPYRGSECAVGWNIARELARRYDVTVITGDVKDSGYEAEYANWIKDNGKIERLEVIYIKPTRSIRFIERLHDIPGLWALYYVAYAMWQKLAFIKAKELHEERHFDLVHHLTMIGYREPGYMWKLGIPFFWGPVGGSVNEPVSFASVYSLSGRIKVLLRCAINGFQKRVLPRPRMAAKVAKKIWAVTSADMETITQIWGAKCEQMLETASTPVSDVRVRTWDGASPLRIVWSGTHTYGKAMPILIKALVGVKEKVENVAIQVDVMGKGEETEKWKRLAAELGVGGFFNWIGYVPRSEALKIMNEAHVLTFTSVKEGTPHVVMEALSLGLPVICHDACGMGMAVNDGSGWKIPLKSPDISVDGFACTIAAILRNHRLIEEKSSGALERATALTWEEKANCIAKAYEENSNSDI